MSLEEKQIKLLEKIAKLLEDNQYDYCDTDVACRIMGLNNCRYLAQLHKKDLLPRYKRGVGFKYKKTDCYRIAAHLDNQTIVLEPLSKEKDEKKATT